MTSLGAAVPDLRVRHREPELMDDPTLDAGRHANALKALERVNHVSLASRRVWRDVLRIHDRVRRPVRVLDIACGGGDVLAGVARRARRRGVPVVLHGGDVSPVALAEVRRRAIEAFALDALRDPIPPGYDLIVSALFLHHLERPDAVDLLRRMAEHAGHAILVQDLARTPLGYALAWLGLHTLTTSDVARIDGLRSVRAAFSIDEVRGLCVEAGLVGARVEHAWPERFTVRWARR